MTNNLDFNSNETQYLTFLTEPTNEILLFDVNINNITGGTYVSNPSTLTDIEKGTIISIGALPDDGYVFTNWVVNGIINTSNPLVLTVNKDYNISTQFEQTALVKSLQVFDSIPVERGNWYFGDHSTKDNDVEIGNCIVGNTYLNTVKINVPVSLVGGYPMDFYCEVGDTGYDVLKNYFMVSAGGFNSTQKGLTIRFIISSGQPYFNILVADGVTSNNSGFYMTDSYKYNEQNKISFIWDGVSVNAVITINGDVYNYNFMLPWVGDSYQTLVFGGYSTYTIAGLWSIYNLTHNNKTYNYILNHGQGTTIYNLADPTGLTDAIVSGANLETFWGSTADVEPYEHTLGATLYQVPYVNYLSNNLVNNAGFDTIGYWSLGANTSIINGVGKYTNAAGNTHISQGYILTIGKKYEIKYTVLNYVIGRFHAQTGAGTLFIVMANGTYTTYLTATGNRLYLTAGAALNTFDIDNISAREIDAIPVGVEGSIMPICAETTQAITGFTNLGWFPSGSGALKGLPNKYYITGCEPTIIDGDYTADEIGEFVESENIIIEQDNYSIKKLTVKQ